MSGFDSWASASMVTVAWGGEKRGEREDGKEEKDVECGGGFLATGRSQPFPCPPLPND